MGSDYWMKKLFMARLLLQECLQAPCFFYKQTVWAFITLCLTLICLASYQYLRLIWLFQVICTRDLWWPIICKAKEGFQLPRHGSLGRVMSIVLFASESESIWLLFLFSYLSLDYHFSSFKTIFVVQIQLWIFAWF